MKQRWDTLCKAHGLLLGKKICWLVLFMISGIAAMAQAYSDSLSVTVYYPCGNSIIYYKSNIHALDRFIHQVDSVGQRYIIKPVTLSIVSSASPEGGIMINRKLSRSRGRSVLDYLNTHSETFRSISSLVSCHTEELTTNHLLGMSPQDRYPAMRYARVTLHLAGEDKDSLITSSQPDIDSISSGDSGTPSTQVEISETSAGTEDVADTSSIQVIPAESATKPESLPDTPDGKASPCRPCLFLKTNMLYDLLTFVNVSVEVPFSEHLTAEATVVYPWWRDASRHKTIQMRYVAVTPRYYFNNADRSYTSLFAGLTVGGGKYDLQWTRRGVQGSMWHVSPVIGYSHHISKRWKMEYSASVGFVHTKYQKYTQTSDTPYGEIKVKDYPWVSKVLNTVLPTSLNVSIVYTFTKSKQIGHHEE